MLKIAYSWGHPRTRRNDGMTEQQLANMGETADGTAIARTTERPTEQQY